MNIALGLLAAAVTPPVLAVAQDRQEEIVVQSDETRAPALSDPASILTQRANCRDMMMHVQEQQQDRRIRGRDMARPVEPMQLAAVDYDVDGCDVLLTSEGPRPLPQFDEGDLRSYRAARAGQ